MNRIVGHSNRSPRGQRALIICNGEPPSRVLARRTAAQSDLVVAADGGANISRRYGILPDVIIGDLDSITSGTRRFFTAHPKGRGTTLRGTSGEVHTLIIRNSRQDNTDLEKALDYLREQNIREVSILGVTGRRIDFTLGNLSVMWNYTADMQIAVIGDGWYAIPVAHRKIISARPGTTVSLIPFGPCRGITLKGLVFPLKEASMRVGEIGVSNVVHRSPFSVTIRSGKALLFVMASYDHPVVR